MRKLLSTLKNLAVPKGRRVRRVPFGLLRGLRIHADMRNGMQAFVGLSELELAPWFRKLSAGIRTAFDVGANEGHYTLFWLAKSSARTVWAFEPAADALSVLRANLDANQLGASPRVHVVDKFVGAKDDTAHCALDTIARDAEGPCLIKVDIEGAELEALRGAEALLRRNDVRFIIEVHSLELERECAALLDRNGYRIQPIGKSPIRRILPEQRPRRIQLLDRRDPSMTRERFLFTTRLR